MLRRPQIPADDTLISATDKPMKGAWLINTSTVRYMGALPVGANFDAGKTCGSTYVGWTREYQLVLVHFPEQ